MQRPSRTFFKAVEVRTDAYEVTRLGKKNNDRSRPIKIRMANTNDKESVMNNLFKLKEAPTAFRKISVTDDFTAQEREEIKMKVNEAKRKTESEGEGKYVFKLRGSPKNGLVIRRFAVAK